MKLPTRTTSNTLGMKFELNGTLHNFHKKRPGRPKKSTSSIEEDKLTDIFPRFPNTFGMVRQNFTSSDYHEISNVETRTLSFPWQEKDWYRGKKLSQKNMSFGLLFSLYQESTLVFMSKMHENSNINSKVVYCNILNFTPYTK